MLMLYFPWRVESIDLMGAYKSYEEHYDAVKEIVIPHAMKYRKYADILDEAQKQLEQRNDDDDEVIVAPNAQSVDAEDRNEGTKPSEEFACFNPTKTIRSCRRFRYICLPK